MASYIKNRYIAPLYKICIYTKYACGIYYAYIGLYVYITFTAEICYEYILYLKKIKKMFVFRGQKTWMTPTELFSPLTPTALAHGIWESCYLN